MWGKIQLLSSRRRVFATIFQRWRGWRLQSRWSRSAGIFGSCSFISPLKGPKAGVCNFARGNNVRPLWRF